MKKSKSPKKAMSGGKMVHGPATKLPMGKGK
jgi:hypothetical protein